MDQKTTPAGMWLAEQVKLRNDVKARQAEENRIVELQRIEDAAQTICQKVIAKANADFDKGADETTYEQHKSDPNTGDIWDKATDLLLNQHKFASVKFMPPGTKGTRKLEVKFLVL